MKKFLTLTLIVLTSYLILCDYSPRSISIKYVDNITIKLLSFPPKMKKITEEKDLEEIINLLNTINYNATKEKDINEFLILIDVHGELNCSLVFTDNLARINGTWYKVDNNALIELRNIYNKLQYDEIPISLIKYNKLNKELNFINCTKYKIKSRDFTSLDFNFVSFYLNLYI